MEFKKINEFKKGDKIEGFYIIKSVESKVTNNSSTNKYLDFNFTDPTGEINAKLWESGADIENTYKENMLIKVKAIVNEWRGKLQLKIETIRPSNSDDGVKIQDFVAVAPYEPEVMYHEIMECISNMQNEDIKNITKFIIEENKEKLMHYPAAKSNHHAIRSGLLYHSTTMLKAGIKLSELYTFINKDLLFAGIILHDIAKIYEMNASELGIVSEYTLEGQLLGHIVQGIRMVERASEIVKADKETATLLEHMILSHHYEPEYGSPKKPMIPEAELLHHLDMIDARMYDMKKALGDTEDGKFSERIWSLDNLSVYKSFVK